MRKNILGILFIALIAVSCNNAKKDEKGSLSDKKAQLEKLRGEQKKLNDQVQSLEAEIAKLDPTAAAGAAKLVTVAPAKTGEFSHFIDLQGRIDATNTALVAPANGQGGLITALYVTQGQAVKKGQLLAKLDEQTLNQQIEPLKVQLAAAEDTYKRTKNLYDQGIGAYQNVLNAKTQVETLQKQIAIYQKQASLMNVVAPISGVADVVTVRVGELYNPMGLRVVNTNDLKVVANVPENYIGRVKEGSRIDVILPEQNNRTISAVVNTVQKVVDPTTRAFTIEAKIPSQGDLKPNQLAQIRILDYSKQNVLVIPLNVVQSDENGKYVYVLEKNGDKSVARKKLVTVGESYRDGIEILTGLNEGDQVITEGYQNLYEGQVITTNVAQG
jgi:membrane fusion protein, multidrug efflux system